jgi:hypothetical protein
MSVYRQEGIARLPHESQPARPIYLPNTPLARGRLQGSAYVTGDAWLVFWRLIRGGL